MSSTHITCPHCHTSHVRQVRYKSTLYSILRNGLFGTLSLRENAAANGTDTLDSYCCQSCGVVFAPAVNLDPPQLMLN